MNFFTKRIDRRTYSLGMLLALSITIVIALILLLPLAAIGFVIPAISGSATIEKFILLIPAFFLSVATLSLLIRRAHDLGSDGALWFGALLAGILLRIFSDSSLVNLLPVMVIVSLCLLPGQRRSNRYGKMPPKKFKIKSIVT